MQYDLDAELRAGKRPFWDPIMSTDTWRSVFDLFNGN
jgi:hypothetical protein